MTGVTHSRWRGFAGGIALASAVALLGMAVAEAPAARNLGLSPLTLAILLGIIAGNSFFPAVARHVGPGVEFAKGVLLRTGIVLYGFRITFGQVAEVGVAGVLIDAVMIGLTFTVALVVGTRFLGLDRRSAMLIGTGSAICGAAAVLAAEPVVRGEAHRVSVAVATVVVFGTVSMFLYPYLYPHLHLSPTAFGVYAGSTIHEVAQVVAAGRSIGEAAAATAVIEKMLRVMMLAPFLLLLARYEGSARRESSGSVSKATAGLAIPWFAFGFIALCGFNSLGVLPARWVTPVVQLDTFLLATAMAALGLRTHASAFRQAGIKPLLLGGILLLTLIGGGYCVNRAVSALL